MSDRAIEFVENWASENIQPAGDQTDVGNSRAKNLALRCLNDAAQAGIAKVEIEETFDDLAAFMEGEIEEANSREASRLGADNDNNDSDNNSDDDGADGEQGKSQ